MRPPAQNKTWLNLRCRKAMKGEHYFREQDRAHEKQIERTRRKLDRVAQKLPTLNEAIEKRDLWAKQCNYASERAAAAEVKITDLAMLVRRLSRFAPPQQAARALDYCKRHGLEGSPLRDDALRVLRAPG